MARFLYVGHKPRPELVIQYGPLRQIKVPASDGTVKVMTPIAPAVEFFKDQDIGYEITDPKSLKTLRSDSRFREII